MNSNTPEIQSIASRHGFSSEAVAAAWDALRRGGGSMAQFHHWELGGGGQWLPGMLMIGDMFNNNLKARVDALFNDLRNQPVPPPPPMPPSQQSWKSQPHNGSVSLQYGYAPASTNTWYPAELGFPLTAGSQNHVRYAYFPGPARLAIELFGKVTDCVAPPLKWRCRIGVVCPSPSGTLQSPRDHRRHSHRNRRSDQLPNPLGIGGQAPGVSAGSDRADRQASRT